MRLRRLRLLRAPAKVSEQARLPFKPFGEKLVSFKADVGPSGCTCAGFTRLKEGLAVRIAPALVFSLLAGPAGATQFAPAPLNKPTPLICVHESCAFTLLSVVPVGDETPRGILYSVLIAYDYDNEKKTHLVFNDFVFCSKSRPALFD